MVQLLWKAVVVLHTPASALRAFSLRLLGRLGSFSYPHQKLMHSCFPGSSLHPARSSHSDASRFFSTRRPAPILCCCLFQTQRAFSCLIPTPVQLTKWLNCSFTLSMPLRVTPEKKICDLPVFACIFQESRQPSLTKVLPIVIT